MHNTGSLIVYSGPSGVGKGTLLVPYLKTHPDVVLSVSATTRSPRPGETDGVEYHFITKERFEQLLAEDGFLEYAQYSGNYYGTLRAQVEAELAAGRDVVLEIEVQGAMQIKKSFPDAVFIFVLPPSYEVLKQRLNGRGTEQPEVVQARLDAALQELSFANQYDYVLVNEDADRAREQLAAIITAAKCQSKSMKKFIDKVCDSL